MSKQTSHRNLDMAVTPQQTSNNCTQSSAYVLSLRDSKKWDRAEGTRSAEQQQQIMQKRHLCLKTYYLFECMQHEFVCLCVFVVNAFLKRLFVCVCCFSSLRVSPSIGTLGFREGKSMSCLNSDF